MGVTTIEHQRNEQTHIALMRAVVRNLNDIPLVLKGGTALLLCYGLDRFSEDLDFDANKKFSIAKRIESILSKETDSYTIKIAKDTDTVQRLKIHYHKNSFERLLKLEISFRDEIVQDDTVLMDGIRTYKIKNLIDQKVAALFGRTKARDLYDVDFLLRSYRADFSADTFSKLESAVKDLNTLESRFKPAFEDDDLFDNNELQTLLLSLHTHV